MMAAFQMAWWVLTVVALVTLFDLFKNRPVDRPWRGLIAAALVLSAPLAVPAYWMWRSAGSGKGKRRSA